MKKFVFILFAVSVLISCRESPVEYQPNAINSGIYITTEPSGADIFLNGDKTYRQTPDSLFNLPPGLYSIKLKLVGYVDGEFSINLSKGEKRYIYHSFNNDY